MEISLLFFGLFLLILLAVLLFLFFQSKKKKALNKLSKKEEIKKLDELTLMLKDKSLSTSELKSIVDLILRDYKKIDEFSFYKEIILRIALHPNTNKNIILHFDKELSKTNPSYKKEISTALTKALNSREL